MIFPSYPISFKGEVMARRVNGAVVPEGSLRGPANTITYDVVSITETVSFVRTGLVPHKRPVSALGLQIEIEAADVRDKCDINILSATDIRLSVDESVVYADCAPAPGA